MTTYDIKEIFDNLNVLCYCENHGIYEVYSRNGNTIVYYSFFGNEGFYKVTKNVVTGHETRKHLRYKKIPAFLQGEYGTRYNYYTG